MKPLSYFKKKIHFVFHFFLFPRLVINQEHHYYKVKVEMFCSSTHCLRLWKPSPRSRCCLGLASLLSNLTTSSLGLSSDVNALWNGSYLQLDVCHGNRGRDDRWIGSFLFITVLKHFQVICALRFRWLYIPYIYLAMSCDDEQYVSEISALI
jgi:hypothetical protein